MTTTGRALREREAILSEDHNRGMHSIIATVTSLADVSPTLTRVTLTSPEFAEIPLWAGPNMALRFHLGEALDDASRVYTVRSSDLTAGTIDVDVVRHGADGPMMRWLGALVEGDTVELTGPRPHFTLPVADGRRTMLFLDATAIPALHTMLAHAPSDLTGNAWVATDDVVAFDELPTTSGLNITRIPAHQGFDAEMRSIADPASVVVWGAGERDEMRAVRRFFRSEIGLQKQDVAIFGYWKEGVSNTRIDEARLEAYEQLLASGGTVGEQDDLSIEI